MHYYTYPDPTSNVVKLANIWQESLFEMYTKHVWDSGGDGCGLILCGNPDETATLFEEWWKQNKFYEDDKIKKIVPMHPRSEHDGIINFHDNNENFVFSDRPIKMWLGDYTFVVETELKSYKRDNNKIIMPYVSKDSHSTYEPTRTFFV